MMTSIVRFAHPVTFTVGLFYIVVDALNRSGDMPWWMWSCIPLSAVLVYLSLRGIPQINETQEEVNGNA